MNQVEQERHDWLAGSLQVARTVELLPPDLRVSADEVQAAWAVDDELDESGFSHVNNLYNNMTDDVEVHDFGEGEERAFLTECSGDLLQLEFVQPEDIPDDAVCYICIDAIDRQEWKRVMKLSCKHLFHSGCIANWLVRTNTCPTCRAKNSAC